MIACTTRNLMGLTNIGLRYSFCIQKALLNPYKHTTMMHSPHNMFVDLYDFGEYPQVILPASIPSRAYQPIVVSTLVSVFNSTYATNLTQKDITNNLSKSWSRFIVKNLNTNNSKFQEVIAPVLNKLATQIIVKENKWTWIRQQRQRLSVAPKYINKYNPETIQDFITGYNKLIEQLVLVSSHGLSPHIPQAQTPLQKHYVQEMLASKKQGVIELNELQGDKDNYINQALAFIHRL